jgi:hypothetical protein
MTPRNETQKTSPRVKIVHFGQKVRRDGRASFQKTERPDFRPADPLRTNFSPGAAPQTYASKPTHRTLHFCTVNTLTLPEVSLAASHQYWLQKGAGLYLSRMHLVCNARIERHL